MAKILIIEDDEILYRMYQQLLENHGYQVSIGIDGEQGLKLALSEHPDLVLLDIRLPKMDGVKVLKLLRKDAWGSKVSVIILTNVEANDELLKEVSNVYPTHFLIKSNVEYNQVLEKIKSILEKSKQT